MTAFTEVFNELFGTTLDTEQLSDHCTLMIALSFLQCMVPISSIDASSFIGRNNRRDHVYGLEPFVLKIMPYVRTVFVRYWSQHFLRVDNPRMVSTRYQRVLKRQEMQQKMQTLKKKRGGMRCLSSAAQRRKRIKIRGAELRRDYRN